MLKKKKPNTSNKQKIKPQEQMQNKTGKLSLSCV